MDDFIEDEQIDVQNDCFEHTININGTNKIVYDTELDAHTKNISILDGELNRLADAKLLLTTKKLAYTTFAAGAALSWAGVAVNQILSNLEPQIFNFIFFPSIIGIAAIQTLRCNRADKLCDERAYNVLLSIQNEKEKYQQRKDDIEKNHKSSEFMAYR